MRIEVQNKYSMKSMICLRVYLMQSTTSFDQNIKLYKHNPRSNLKEVMNDRTGWIEISTEQLNQ